MDRFQEPACHFTSVDVGSLIFKRNAERLWNLFLFLFVVLNGIVVANVSEIMVTITTLRLSSLCLGSVMSLGSLQSRKKELKTRVVSTYQMENKSQPVHYVSTGGKLQ